MNADKKEAVKTCVFCKAPVMAMSPIERLIPGGRIEMIFNFSNPMQFLMNGDSLSGQAIAHTSVTLKTQIIQEYLRQGGGFSSSHSL